MSFRCDSCGRTFKKASNSDDSRHFFCFNEQQLKNVIEITEREFRALITDLEDQKSDRTPLASRSITKRASQSNINHLFTECLSLSPAAPKEVVESPISQEPDSPMIAENAIFSPHASRDRSRTRLPDDLESPDVISSLKYAR